MTIRSKPPTRRSPARHVINQGVGMSSAKSGSDDLGASSSYKGSSCQGRGFFLGVDPGKTGALCALSANRLEGGIFFQDYGGPRLIPQVIEALRKMAPVLFAVIEDVDQMKMPPRKAARVQTLIQTASYWKMAFICSGIDFQEIAPREWQREMIVPSCRVKDPKRSAINSVHHHYPELAEKIYRISKDHNRADAALMAGYARRLWDLQRRRADAVQGKPVYCAVVQRW